MMLYKTHMHLTENTMITVPLIKVALKLDMSTTNQHVVPPHELALLKEMHGSRAIEQGLFGKTRELDPEEEYARLQRRYGMDKETKRPWVEVVFGRLHEGRLENTMIKGAEHYSPKSPQKKAAETRAKKKADKHAEDAIPATG